MNILRLVPWVIIGVATLIGAEISKLSYTLIWLALILEIVHIAMIEGWRWKK